MGIKIMNEGLRAEWDRAKAINALALMSEHEKMIPTHLLKKRERLYGPLPSEFSVTLDLRQNIKMTFFMLLRMRGHCDGYGYGYG